MARYLTHRLWQSLVLWFLFLTLVFLLVQAQPGDYSTAFTLNPRISAETRAEMRHSFGLDQPVYIQYALYLRNFLKGDLGTSFVHGRPVVDVVLERMPRTVALFATGLVVSFYLGFVIGKSMAWRIGGALDHASTIGGVILFTVFTPWLALMVLWVFGLQLGWFPIGKFVAPELWHAATFDANYVFLRMLATVFSAGSILIVAAVLLRQRGVRARGGILLGLCATLAVAAWMWWSRSGLSTYGWDILRHMVLPVGVITAVGFAGTMLLTRGSMIEVLREDFVTAARARGLPDRIVRDRHVARNAMLPIMTSLILSLPTAVDGSVVIETIFSWPGLGLTLVQSLRDRDIPLAVGAILFIGLLSLLAHVVADVAYVFLDPRVRYS